MVQFKNGNVGSLGKYSKKKKKLPECVLGHLESFKTHLLLGEIRGVPPFFKIFCPNFINFEDFYKYFGILGVKKKKNFFARSA